LGNAIK